MEKYLLKLYNAKIFMVLFLATFVLFWFFLPEEVPLYYSMALREDRLAGKYELLIMPLIVAFYIFVGHKFLEKLALKNTTMENLIRAFLIGSSIVMYLVFLKIILLVV